MKATCWYGKHDVRVEDVPDPVILNQHDAIIKVSSTAICGSDLHLYNGLMPTMQAGDILGHEFMGEVIEVGSEVKQLQIGDRVVVAFPIACGQCWADSPAVRPNTCACRLPTAARSRCRTA
jgi:threonine dehydrogenase-like Zn-dependent dehydrogenase